MSFLSEFKEFAVKGSVIDLAVGVIIGGAFGKIVTALVDSVIMPVISVLLGGINFTEYGWVLKAADGDNPAIILGYGILIQNIIYFILMAFIIFLMVKLINKLKRSEEKEIEAAPAELTTEEKLLTQIRDLLAKK